MTATYLLGTSVCGYEYILCHRCERKSYNKNDIEQKFCGKCGFHPPESPSRARKGMTESPNDWLREPLLNFKVIVNHGVTVTPRWYDFPRRLGWRVKKRESILDMRGDQVVIDSVNGIIYCTPAMEERLRGAIPDCNFISV